MKPDYPTALKSVANLYAPSISSRTPKNSFSWSIHSWRWSTYGSPSFNSFHIDALDTPESLTHLSKIVSWVNNRTLKSLSLRICQSIDLQPLIEACSPCSRSEPRRRLTLYFITQTQLINPTSPVKSDHPTGGTTFSVLKNLTLLSAIISPIPLSRTLLLLSQLRIFSHSL